MQLFNVKQPKIHSLLVAMGIGQICYVNLKKQKQWCNIFFNLTFCTFVGH